MVVAEVKVVVGRATGDSINTSISESASACLGARGEQQSAVVLDCPTAIARSPLAGLVDERPRLPTRPLFSIVREPPTFPAEGQGHDQITGREGAVSNPWRG